MESLKIIKSYLKFFNIDHWIKQFPYMNLGPEVLFIILGAVFIILWGLSLGRTRALVSLLSIYIAFVLSSVFPYFDYVHKVFTVKVDTSLIRVGIFFAVCIVVFSIMNGSLVKVRLSMKETSIFWVGLISVLQLGLLISIIVNTLTAGYIARVPTAVLPFFVGAQPLFIWFTLPVLALLFIKRD